MFNMVDQFAVRLAQPEVPRRRIHLLLNLRVQLPARFKLKVRNEICRVDQGLIFQAFLIRQRAVVGPFSSASASIRSWTDAATRNSTIRCADSMSRQRLKGSSISSRLLVALMSLR
ncbi:hypothetical protein SBA3_790014 [Candidatus Sulfopaludibacter sp. SbA3]|nr:hypothetical protein SBA3_790014 [Candidatus Sulfopaludibacter sp. SbA3]